MILILTQCFPSRVGGIESLVSNLALELGKNNQVIVFADQHHILHDSIYDNQKKDKIIIRRTKGLKFFRRRKKFKDTINIIESNKIKLIIADSWKSLELPIEYINKKNIPTICLAHGNEVIFKNESKKIRIKKILNKVNLIIANSKYTMDLVKKLTNKTNIRYVYPGANDLRNVQSDEFIKLNGSPVIITISRLEKRKGHAQIIKSFKQLVRDFPNIKYVIAGEGPEKKNILNLISKYSLEKNISLVGLVNESQKEFLFKNSDLMVMPTLDESNKESIEGFGIVYIEAAFFGIPSIASDIGGTKEAVLHNKTGIIINDMNDLYKSIYDLLINDKKRIELGIEAKKRAVERFKWENVTEMYLKDLSI